MPYCQKCGEELADDATFCSSCGAQVGDTKPIDRRAGKREECFGSSSSEACFGPPGSGAGLWGAVSGGVFLMGLVVLWYYDYWWPGILFLIAIMMIIGGIVAYTRRL